MNANFVGYDREAIKAYGLQDSVALEALMLAVDKYDPRVFADRNLNGVKAIARAIKNYTETYPAAMEDYSKI